MKIHSADLELLSQHAGRGQNYFNSSSAGMRKRLKIKIVPNVRIKSIQTAGTSVEVSLRFEVCLYTCIKQLDSGEQIFTKFDIGEFY
jgi:hypothetical protein